jgi:hypothetical protein
VLRHRQLYSVPDDSHWDLPNHFEVAELLWLTLPVSSSNAAIAVLRVPRHSTIVFGTEEQDRSEEAKCFE